MRTGVTASTIAHVAVIVIALIGFNHANQLTPEAEQSIAVDLVPITDTTSIRAGSEKSKIIDTKTPSIVEDSHPVVPAQPTGNTTQDQPQPTEADIPKPSPTKNSAPAPTLQPQPQQQPVVPAQPPAQAQPQPATQPQPAPQPPVETPKPQPKAADAPADQQLAADNSPSPDTAPVVPTPSPQTSSLEQKRAELQKQQAAAAKAAADAAAKAAADAAAKAKADAAAKAAAVAAEKAIADAKAAQAKKDADAKKLALAQQADAAAKAADEISAIINKEKTTGAKTGQGGTPTAGKATGHAAALSKGEMDAFAAQVKPCFHLLPNETESGLVVDLLVNMNPDGTVKGVPSILQADSSSTGQSIARAGQRAVMQCGPYTALPRDKYEEWKQIDLELDAQP
ncbi:MAG: hypothetical protein P4M09_22700 [Devosia sp.]|nr:hypothetical protein [Devosia sp.]